MNEYLDVFDSMHHYLGTALREEVHKQGMWHQTFHCWIVLEESKQRYLLFQIRHPKKDYPNLLDISAAGHLLSGEEPLEGIRELEEEVGLRVEDRKLQSVGVIKQQLENASLKDNEFCHVFLLKDDRPLSKYVVQQEELRGLVKVSLRSFSKLVTGEQESVRAEGFVIEKGKRVYFGEKVSKEQFVPHDSFYYKTICKEANKLD